MIKRNTVVALALLLISQFAFALQDIAPIPARLKNKTLSVARISRGGSDGVVAMIDSSGAILGAVYCSTDPDGYSFLRDNKGYRYEFSDVKKCWKTIGLLEKYSGDKDVAVKILLDLDEDKVTRVDVIDTKDQAKVDKSSSQATK